MSTKAQIVSEPFTTVQKGRDDATLDAPGWPTKRDGLVLIWAGENGWGTWSVTHQATGLAITPGGSCCCSRHAHEWVERLGEFDWTSIGPERGSPEARKAAAAAASEAGDPWVCGDFRERVTPDEAVVLTRWALRDVPSPRVDQAVRAALDIGAVRTSNTEAEPVEW